METKPSPADDNKSASTPVMDVVVAPPDAPKPSGNQPDTSQSKQDKPEKQGKPDTQITPEHEQTKNSLPHQPSNNVGTAIIATVIIVLALSALATYAYVKSR